MSNPTSFRSAAIGGTIQGAVLFAALIVGGVVSQWMRAPTPEPGPTPVVATVPESWIVLDSAGVRVTDSTVEKIAGSLKAGRWTAQGIPKPGERGVTLSIVVDDGVVPLPPPPPPDPKPPEPPVVVPTELQPAVAALKPFPAQRVALAKFYADFAGVIEFSDPNQLQTTSQVQAALLASLKQFAATGVMTGAPKVGEFIDAYVAGQVGLDDVALDAAKRAKIVAAYKTVAQSLGG